MATYVADNVHIDPRAVIEDDVEIGPFCFIGPHVLIGRGTRLQNSVTLTGRVSLGQCNQLYPGVVVGAEPQDISYTGGETCVTTSSASASRSTAVRRRRTESRRTATTIS
jgi:UDP-N-acetylglucosamine acyltransferase